jgi:hypothetical protein
LLAEVFNHKLLDRLPAPVSPREPCRLRSERGPTRLCKGSSRGVSRNKSVNQSPTVCISRSSISAIFDAGHPCASSHSACQRSRSHGVGGRHMRSRTRPSPSATAPAQQISRSFPTSRTVSLKCRVTLLHSTPPLRVSFRYHFSE